MATIANLLIHLGVDTRDVRKDTRGVAPAAEQAGVEAGSRFKSGFRRGLAGFASMVGSVTKTVVAGATAMTIAAAGIGIKTAASMEQAQIGFSTMLHSGQKAQAFLEDLSAFSAKTPFEFPGVRDAARQLLGVGQAAKTVIPTLTAFGDASGALGLSQDQFNRIMLATTQALGKGKFQAEELLQMTEAGLPVWPLLAKALGKPVPELQKLASQGKLVAQDVLPKLEAQMRKDYGGAMAKQSQTLTGLWSTLTDTVSMGLGKAILPLAPALGRAATAATNLADKGLAKLADFIETKGAPAVTKFADKLEAMLGGGGFAATAKSIGDAVKGLVAGFDSKAAGEGMASIGDSLSKLGPVVKDLISQLPSFNDLINVGATVLKFLADHSDLLAKSLPILVAAIVAYKVAQAAGNVAAAAAIPLRVAEAAASFGMKRALRAHTAALVENTAVTRAATGATGAGTAAENAGRLARVRNTAAAVASRIATVAVSAATKAWTATQWLLNAALSANPIGLVILAIVALVAVVVLLWQKNETFRKIVIAAWNAIKVAAVAVFDFLKGYFVFVFGVYKKAFTILADAAKWVWDKVSTWFTKIVSFVAGLPGKIRSAAKGLFDGIVAAAKGGINKVISLWNRLDFGINIRVPDWVPGVGGKGFSIPDLFPDIPMLAKGAIVPATPGGRLAILGEGRDDEAVAPIPTLRAMIRGAVREGFGGEAPGGGIHVENLIIKAFSDRFSLRQVQEELFLHAVR